MPIDRPVNKILERVTLQLSKYVCSTNVSTFHKCTGACVCMIKLLVAICIHVHVFFTLNRIKSVGYIDII